MTVTRTLKLIVAVSMAAQLIGCAAMYVADPALDAQVKKFEPKADVAQIYVCRNSTKFGMAVQPAVYVDDEPIGVVGVSSYAYAEVPPGEHRLVAKTFDHDSKMDVITFKAGEQKFFYVRVSWGVITGWGIIDEDTDDEGRDCVKNGVLVQITKPDTVAAASRPAGTYGTTATNTNNPAKIEEKPVAAPAPATPSKAAEVSPAKVTTTSVATPTPPATAASTQNTAKPTPAPAPTGSGYAAIDDVTAVPYLTEQGRNSYREYLSKDAPKAFAIASNGGAYSVWGKSRDLSLPASARERALVLCERVAKRPCELYAVDSTVVWVKP